MYEVHHLALAYLRDLVAERRADAGPRLIRDTDGAAGASASHASAARRSRTHGRAPSVRAGQGARPGARPSGTGA